MARVSSSDCCWMLLEMALISTPEFPPLPRPDTPFGEVSQWGSWLIIARAVQTEPSQDATCADRCANPQLRV